MTPLHRQWSKIHGKPLLTLAREACWRAQRRWERSRFFPRIRRKGCPVTFFNAPYYTVNPEGISEEGRRCILEFAEEICQGHYPFLGYGTVDLGRQPRWNLDFVSGLDWPDIPSDNPRSIRNDGSDVKVPYELSRLQFLPLLGKAYVLSSDERYRTVAKDLLSDWIAKNPAGVGINWTMAMEVALRGMSVCFVLNLFWPMRADEQGWLKTVERSLWEHLLYVEAHNEFSHMIRSNHYLSNIVGLYCLSQFLHGHGMRSRRHKYKRLIQREILFQVYKDGGDYEASTGYHVLVTQMFTSAFMLMRGANETPDPSFMERLRLMYSMLAALADARGELPHVGDCDDGRVELLTDDLQQMLGLPIEQRNSLRISNLLGIGSGLFGNCSGAMDDARWHGYADRSAMQASGVVPSLPKEQVVIFPNSGIAIARSPDAELLFFAMPNGIGGKGSHTHNDKLSVVLRIEGEQLLCDSGTYCYLRDGNARNRFRSTAAHNTLLVDGLEQNSFSPSSRQIFCAGDEASVSPIECSESDSGITFRASHTGYQDRASVTHTRTVRICADDQLELEDELQGRGIHFFESNLHIGPAWRVASVKEDERGVVCLIEGPLDVVVIFDSSARLQATIESGEFSATFAGKCVRIDVIRVRAKTALPVQLKTRIAWTRKPQRLQQEFQEYCVEE